MKELNFVLNALINLRLKISGNTLLKGLFVIGSGNALAQSVNLVSTPIITRLYTPSDLGTLSLYTSVLSIITVIATFRYEFAYPLPKEDKKATNLLALTVLILFISSFSLFMIILLMGSWLIGVFDLKCLENYLWLFIIGYFGLGFYSVLNNWAVRNCDYKRITYTKVSQSFLGAFVKIVMGILSLGPLGLILGHIVSQAAGIRTLLKGVSPTHRYFLKETSFSEIKITSIEYKSFPLYSLPASLLNMVALHVPTIMLSSIYGMQVVGWYALARGMLFLPITIISQSLSQVYLGESAKLVREGSPELSSFYIKAIKNLFIASLPLIIIPTILAPWLFPLIFGEEWKAAGYYCIPLSIMTISSFVASSTSKLGLYGYNKWQFKWDLARTLLVLAGFIFSSWISLSVLFTLTVYSITMTLMYIILVLLNIKAISNLNKVKSK